MTRLPDDPQDAVHEMRGRLTSLLVDLHLAALVLAGEDGGAGRAPEPARARAHVERALAAAERLTSSLREFPLPSPGPNVHSSPVPFPQPTRLIEEFLARARDGQAG